MQSSRYKTSFRTQQLWLLGLGWCCWRAKAQRQIMRGHQVWKRGTLARVLREQELDMLDDVVLEGFPLAPAPLVIALRSAL